jgi:ATP-dependent helicase HrpA
MGTVHELEQAHAALLASWPRGRPLPDALAEVPWLLEELRVSLFAQGLGVRGVVSAKRIRRMLAEAGDTGGPPTDRPSTAAQVRRRR